MMIASSSEEFMKCPIWPCAYWIATWVVTLIIALIGGYKAGSKRGTGTRT